MISHSRRHPAAFASSLKRLGWRHSFANFLDDGRVPEVIQPYEDEILAQARSLVFVCACTPIATDSSTEPNSLTAAFRMTRLRPDWLSSAYTLQAGAMVFRKNMRTQLAFTLNLPVRVRA